MKKKELDNKYWRELKGESAMAGITLDPTISASDFVVYGNRLAEKQIEMFENFVELPLKDSSVLDVGCGIGRVSKPFAGKFKNVVGIDVNADILKEAEEYIKPAENIKFINNDGKMIPSDDNSFDCVYSGGVIQHIPDINIITNYFEEGLRVLKVNGVLNYSVQVWMIIRKGGIHGDRVGAQIRATDIEKVLNKTGHELVQIYFDEHDPEPHFNIIIKKVDKATAIENITNRRQNPFKIDEGIVKNMNVRTGSFEDLESFTHFKTLWKKKRTKKVTFFKQPISHLLKQVILAIMRRYFGFS